MDRKSEITALLHLSEEEVIRRAGKRLRVCEDIDTLHQQMAEDIAAEIEAAAKAQRALRLILPVGPTGQYPILSRIITERSLSLAHCWFFFMDEYCDDDGKVLPGDHPLSFNHVARTLFLDHLPESCELDPEKVIFPNEDNIGELADLIASAGGIDTCYGGIGIHGHVAFNEPEPGISEMSCRKVRLNDFTITINAVRGHVGGNLISFPREAYTLGMKEILSARKIRLYCRNGCEFDWANTVLRLALFGELGDDFPVTHIRNHDYIITTDRETLASPKIIL